MSLVVKLRQPQGSPWCQSKVEHPKLAGRLSLGRWLWEGYRLDIWVWGPPWPGGGEDSGGTGVDSVFWGIWLPGNQSGELCGIWDVGVWKWVRTLEVPYRASRAAGLASMPDRHDGQMKGQLPASSAQRHWPHCTLHRSCGPEGQCRQPIIHCWEHCIRPIACRAPRVG